MKLEPHEKRLYDAICELIADGFGAELERIAQLMDGDVRGQLREIASGEFCALRTANDLIARAMRPDT